MAFFTDSRDIAERYAKDKADTSLAYDEEYEDYYAKFRVNKNGKSVKVQDLWRGLPFSEKQRLKEAGKHITWDENIENIVWDDDATHGLGNWDAYTLNSHNGNAIEALIDCWLESGELYGREGDFVRVLELAGIEGVEYRDPDARYEKVYDTYLKIQNPFNTAMASEAFVAGFEEWYAQQPKGKYDRDTASADLWDKNNQTAASFAERLREDIANGTSYAWTSIPDSVTDYLKHLGYDGIQDAGGKNGGESHTVWIPFSSEQIKSADPITYDDDGDIIPLSERFNPENVDIRFSLPGTSVPSESRNNVDLGAALRSDNVGSGLSDAINPALRAIDLPSATDADNPLEIRDVKEMLTDVENGSEGIIEHGATIDDVEYAQMLNGKLSGFNGYNQTVDRVVKEAAGGNDQVHSWLGKNILDPLRTAKDGYSADVAYRLENVSENIVNKLGIKKGSAESAAIMWIGEGKRITGLDGDRVITTDYTLDDLKKDFPTKWQSIVEAERTLLRPSRPFNL